MKKIFKYFLFIAIFAICFMTNAKATVIESNDIDWEGENIEYNENSETFEVTDLFLNDKATSLNITVDELKGKLVYTYYWAYVSDSSDEILSAYNNLKDALSSGDETTINQKEMELYTKLSYDISDDSWSGSRSYSGDGLVPGGLYVKWVKVSANDNSFEPIYSIALYKVNSSGTSGTSSVSNPDTGINTLYAIPVLLVLGSVLVFKKRRYE